MTEVEQVKAEVRGAVKAPALIGGGQLLVGLIVLVVGIGYDWWEREPGLAVWAALFLMGGPGFAVAALRARALLTGQIVTVHAKLKEESKDAR